MKQQLVFRYCRFLFMMVFCCLLVSGCVSHQPMAKHPEPELVTILFFNDLHGHLMPFRIKTPEGMREVGGIARLATLIQEIRDDNNRKNNRTLVVVAGDILQGTPMSTVFEGEPDVKCLNAMKVDALTVGNHEFDFGLNNFMKLCKEANFPFLSANIIQKENGHRLCRESLSVPLVYGLELTIIGVTTRDLLTTTKAENVESLDVLDPIASVRDAYEQVKSKGPVLLLSHSRHQTDRAIAQAIPELTAIIGGHDQILLSPYRKVGPVPVFQAFEKGRYLGRFDLEIDPLTKKAKLIGYTYLPVNAAILPEPRIADIVAAYHDRLDEKFKEIIGQAGTFLDGERERIRFQETGLGNFIADIMTRHSGAQIGLINAGAIRASINEGPVTVEDIYKAMPYCNELVRVKLTGTEIKQVLQRAARGCREDEDGGFLQVSGLVFDIRDRKAENIRFGRGKQALDPLVTYDVVIPDFLATGGDGYSIFKDKPHVKTMLPLRELLVDTFKREGTVHAGVEGRIRRLD